MFGNKHRFKWEENIGENISDNVCEYCFGNTAKAHTFYPLCQHSSALKPFRCLNHLWAKRVSICAFNNSLEKKTFKSLIKPALCPKVDTAMNMKLSVKR